MKTNFLFWTAIVAVVAAVSCNRADEVLAVRLDQNKIELVKGDTLQLNAQVVPAQDVEFTWYSQDPDYVTVDKNGLVIAVGLKKEGDEVLPVSVYAKYMNGADECQVTVLPLAPTKLEIDYAGNLLKLDPGAESSVQLKVNLYPEDADLRDVKWTTSAASFVTVDQNGRVTGVATGYATIRASYSEKIFDELDVWVNAIEPTGILIDPAELSLEVGQRSRLKPVLEPSYASGKVVWTSDNPEVVAVNTETGVVEAKLEGTANIKVQVGACAAICKVTVK